MPTTTVAELKRSISACLRQVKAGEELLITEHGRPVARLLPVKDLASLPESLLDMEKRGLLKRPENPCRQISGICHVPRTQRRQCARQSCRSGGKAGKYPGYIDHLSSNFGQLHRIISGSYLVSSLALAKSSWAPVSSPEACLAIPRLLCASSIYFTLLL